MSASIINSAPTTVFASEDAAAEVVALLTADDAESRYAVASFGAGFVIAVYDETGAFVFNL